MVDRPVSSPALRDWLTGAVARVLDVDDELVDPDRPLTELGLSSRDAVALVAALEEHLDRPVNPVVIWSTPTIAGLAELLAAPSGQAAAPDGGPWPGRHRAESSPLPTPPPPGVPAAVPYVRPATRSLGRGAAGRRSARAGSTGPEPAGRASVPRLGDRLVEAGLVTGLADTDPHDTVAVVGLGCRLPGGVRGPHEFWQQLITGRETIAELPAGRWEPFPQSGPVAEAAVAGTPRRGGFLSDLKGFDAGHFRITAREAATMDPQQRLLLEVAWEALLDAGIPPQALAGTRTGVWIGMSGNEYGHFTMVDLAQADAWAPTGSALSIAANRLSYLLDLRGPSVTLDTACSSSLVAVHQAVQALRTGEVDAALVGGANLLLSPAVTVAFHRAGALAADGRCKPFSADADGIVRSEAVGVVVLKRLLRALADGDRVLAVIRGSGVNSDGRSNGLMAPNPAAQEALLREVYASAGIDPVTVGYVEAHGTGTLLGDPVEAAALGAVFGRGRATHRPLLIGSVKGNLGHAEAAAGVIGLIKLVLALRHGAVPASLHGARRNPHIRFEEWRLDLVTRPRLFPRHGGPARGGVSAFGFGGTNAHVALEEWPGSQRDRGWPGPRRSRGARPGPQGWRNQADVVHTAVLTGADDGRVAEAATALADHLLGPGAGVDLGDLTHTLARRRGLDRRRAVVAGRGREGLVAGLRALAGQRSGQGVVPGLPGGVPQDVPAAPAGGRGAAVWVFSGYGSAWTGMGARLLDDEPAFAAAVDDLAGPLLRESGLDLRAAIDGTRPPQGVAEVQCALFGVQVALAATWRAHGHRPAALIGHDLGEVAAAVVSGALSGSGGARVIAVRSRLLQQVAQDGGGAMAVLDLSEDELAGMAARHPHVASAAHASPRQCTVTGDERQAHALADPDDPRGVAGFDASYWRDNVRRPVRFAEAVSAAAADGFTTFVEVSPHPVAAAAVTAALAAVGVPGTVVATLRRDTDDTVSFRAHLAVLAGTPGYVAAGAPGDPEGLGIPLARHVDLPLPVWRHGRHWVSRDRRPAPPPGTHPLLGPHVELPDGGHVFSADVGTGVLPWLADHRVYGTPVLPAAGFAELALAAAGTVLDGPAGQAGRRSLELVDLELHRMLVLHPSTSLTTIVRGSVVDVYARTGAGSLVRHATATVRYATGAGGRDGDATGAGGRAGDGAGAGGRVGDGARPGFVTTAPFDGVSLGSGEVVTNLGRAVDVAATFAAAGHRHGPAFRGVGEAVLRDDGSVLARVALPSEAGPDSRYTVHPALLDACLQTLAPAAAALQADPPEAAVVHLPMAIGSLRVSGDPQRGGICEASVRASDGADGLVGRIRLLEPDGTELLRVDGVVLRPLGRDALALPLADKVFELVWVDEPSPGPGGPGPAAPGRWLVAGRGPLADAVAAELTPTTGEPVRVDDPLAAASLIAGRSVPGAGDGLGVVVVVDEDAARSRPGAAQPWPGGRSAGSDSSTDPRDPTDGAPVALLYQLAAVARALVETEPVGVSTGRTRFWTVVRAADGSGVSLTAGMLRGLVRVLAVEHPRLRATLVDLDPAAEQAVAAEQAAREVLADPGDDEVAWRDGRRRARRLARAGLTEPAVGGPAGYRLRAGGYVIAGGLGRLGLVVAGYLAEHGATRVVLAGRSADPTSPPPEVADLRARGVDVRVVRADVSRAEGVTTALDAATAGGVPLRGVVHAAGVLADELLTDLTEPALQRVWALKVLAGWALHEATRDADLDLWLAFSSAAGMLGSPGQTGYACASTWLDALVELRRSQGLPATSIAWGAWAGTGADTGPNALLDPLPVAEGLQALDAVLAAGRASTGVVRLDLDRMTAALPDLVDRPFFGLVLAGRDRDDGNVAGGSDWAGAGALRDADPEQARCLLRERLVFRVAQIAGRRADELDRDVPLATLGLDSLMAVRAKNVVEHDFGANLPVRLLLQGASLADVEEHLVGQLGLRSGRVRVADPPPPAGQRPEPAGAQ